MEILQQLLMILAMCSLVGGHGRLVEPPSRSTMWRQGFGTPPNYNDNQLFCGGFSTQYNKNGGKCGVCGDPYDKTRENEAPDGKFATGIIGRRYEVGQEIETLVHITANHKGWFQFKLCQNDDPKKQVDQVCFDKHVLADRSGQTKLFIGQFPYCYNHTLKLPDGVRCSACVLQWRYHTGNSWGWEKVSDGVTVSGIGYGAQEEFYGCADIAIGMPVRVGQQTKAYSLCPADSQSGGGGYVTYKPMATDKYNPPTSTPDQTGGQGGDKCNCPCGLNAASSPGKPTIFLLMLAIYYIRFN